MGPERSFAAADLALAVGQFGPGRFVDLGLLVRIFGQSPGQVERLAYSEVRQFGAVDFDVPCGVVRPYQNAKSALAVVSDPLPVRMAGPRVVRNQ